MRALSIRQPWAWLIIRPDLIGPAARAAAAAAGEIKDIENRDWYTPIRGRVLVHAAKGMTRYEYDDADYSMQCKAGGAPIELPAFDELDRGGIVGSVEIVDCVQRSRSIWFRGYYGFVLRDAQPLPFRPLRGALGFFEVPT